MTSWVVGTVLPRKIEKVKSSVAADSDPNHFARKKTALERTDLKPDPNYEIFS
jgi:hypothetical protein